MKSQKQSYLISLQILFSALFIGQLLATLVLYTFLIQPPHNENNADLSNIFPLIAIGLIAIGYFLFNLRRKTWLEESRLAARDSVYSAEVLEPISVAERSNSSQLVEIQLSNEYLKNAGSAAQLRAWQASARLADVLK